MPEVVYINYNTGKSALPDIYALALGHAAPEGECVYIRQSTLACVITYTYIYYIVASYVAIYDIAGYTAICSYV